jgi:hypothetical protein
MGSLVGDEAFPMRLTALTLGWAQSRMNPVFQLPVIYED